MTASDLLRVLWADGISLRLSDDGENLIATGKLSPEHRDLVRSNKAVLVSLLMSSRNGTAALLKSAMHVCDWYGDSPHARQEMMDQCLALPLHLQKDLLEHFSCQASGDCQEARSEKEKGCPR